MQYPPLINGKSYGWSDIILNLMGVPIIGIKSIEYGQDQDIENIYGGGRMPVSRGFGRMTPSAKITLLMEEVENIQTVAPNGLLQDIPEFDIVVTFLDPSNTTRVHKLRNCRFKNNPRTYNEGDTSLEVPLDLVISHIEWI